MEDPSAGLARYYDLSATFPNDIPFYLERLQSLRAAVLELGCGTLSAKARVVVGTSPTSRFRSAST